MELRNIFQIFRSGCSKVLFAVELRDSFVEFMIAFPSLSDRHLEVVAKAMGRHSVPQRFQRQQQLRFQTHPFFSESIYGGFVEVDSAVSNIVSETIKAGAGDPEVDIELLVGKQGLWTKEVSVYTV